MARIVVCRDAAVTCDRIDPLLRGAGFAVTTLAPEAAAPERLDGAASVVLTVGAHGSEPEAAVTRLRAATKAPLLVVFERSRAPVRETKRLLAAAGADETTTAAAPDDALVARVRALLVGHQRPAALVVGPGGSTAACHGQHLLHAGFDIVRAPDVTAAREALAAGPVDALLIDRAASPGDTLTFVAQLRAAGFALPIVLAADSRAPDDRGAAFVAGADDYLEVDAGPDELRTRIARFCRRRLAGSYRSIGSLELDEADRLVRHRGRRLGLRERESALLFYLARREGVSVPSSVLLEDLWLLVPDATPTNALAVTVSRLRSGLRDAGVPEVVRSDGRGYRFDGARLRIGAREATPPIRAPHAEAASPSGRALPPPIAGPLTAVPVSGGPRIHLLPTHAPLTSTVTYCRGTDFCK